MIFDAIKFVHHLCYILLYFLLHRRENLATSLLLLIGCYLAILIPAYFPLNKVKADSDDYHDPRDLVKIHLSAF